MTTADIRIQEKVRSYLKIRHRTVEELAKEVGKKPSTMYYRISHPGKMHVEDLRRIYDILDVPKEDRCW